jgi:hypothetical protein
VTPIHNLFAYVLTKHGELLLLLLHLCWCHMWQLRQWPSQVVGHPVHVAVGAAVPLQWHLALTCSSRRKESSMQAQALG